MLDDEILDHLLAQGNQPRKHAAFFAWYDRSETGKGIAEAGIVASLLEGMAAENSSEFRDVRPSGDRWPDCWAKDAQGNEVPFEVTELVDAAALPAGEDRPWSPAEVRAKLEERIAEKDLRSQGGRGSRRVVVVIHTDELYIDVALALNAIGDRPFPLRHGNLARAFLLFSYDPNKQGYPFLELKLAAQHH